MSENARRGAKRMTSLAEMLLLLSAVGILSRIDLLHWRLVAVNAATVLILAGAVGLMIREWRSGLAWTAAAVILYPLGAALPFLTSLALLTTTLLLQWVQQTRKTSRAETPLSGPAR